MFGFRGNVSATPLVCASCGHDLDRAEGAGCPTCGADLAGVVWTTERGSKPERHDFVDEAQRVRGHVLLRRRKVHEAHGERTTLHAFHAGELPRAAGAWTSARSIPYPPDIELCPDEGEIVTGAFLCGLIGLVARGVVQAALDIRTGWVRHGPFVVPTEATAPRPWLRLATRGASGLPPLETALLMGLEAAAEAQGYRSWGAGFHALADLTAALPTRRDILARTTALPLEEEQVLDAVEARCPRLVSALAAAAGLLRR